MELENNSMNKEISSAQDILEQTEAKKEAATYIDFKMVTFSLAGKDYAIDIMHVKEIAKAGRFTYVPNTLPFVLGVYNLRGEIIPILDLRLFFNIEIPARDENKLENLLILNIEDQIFGVVVDKIDKVVGIQKSTIQPPHPLFGDINIKYIGGVVESNKRLYILLDVLKIFTSKERYDIAERQPEIRVETASRIAAVHNVPEKVTAPKPAAGVVKPAATAPSAATEAEVNVKFIMDTLRKEKSFNVSPINESWVKHRYSEWCKEKGDKAQLQDAADCEKFLSSFWSIYTDQFWSKDYAENLAKLLPDNTARQIVVWNPGCSSGYESYSLACVLKNRYPDAKIRIYAQDTDLLKVSNASLMTVPPQVANSWIGPYLTKKTSGEYTFNQEIKDSIMFEYHDCKNANVLPMIDLIFARDVLSLIDEKAQNAVIEDFIEKLKGNGIVIVGDNEAMPSTYGFSEKAVGSLVGFSKD